MTPDLRLCIAIPSYSGRVHIKLMRDLIAAKAELEQAGVQVTLSRIIHEAGPRRRGSGFSSPAPHCHRSLSGEGW